MGRALAIVAGILTILHSYVSAQAPTCNAGFEWSFNSLNQSPCTMTVAVGGVCVNGVFTLAPLQPGFVYLGPTKLAANSCRCSTVYYSLLSACAYCQNQTYLDWSIYDANCTIVYDKNLNVSIPQGFSIPHYAYLDVVTGNTFNVEAAKTAAASGAESFPVPQATSSTTPIASSTQTSVSASSNKLNVGAIAGGVVGGVVLIGIIAGLIAFIIMRRRKASVSTPSTYTAYATPQFNGADMKYNSPEMSSANVYNPNDPTTFPSAFPNPNNYSSYSGSPQQVTNTFTGNDTLVGGPIPNRTQYTGAPEL